MSKRKAEARYSHFFLSFLCRGCRMEESVRAQRRQGQRGHFCWVLVWWVRCWAEHSLPEHHSAGWKGAEEGIFNLKKGNNTKLILWLILAGELQSQRRRLVKSWWSLFTWLLIHTKFWLSAVAQQRTGLERGWGGSRGCLSCPGSTAELPSCRFLVAAPFASPPLPCCLHG